MTKPESPSPELCAAEYTATRVPVPGGPAKIFITAQGVHNTSGYRVMFHTSIGCLPARVLTMAYQTCRTLIGRDNSFHGTHSFRRDDAGPERCGGGCHRTQSSSCEDHWSQSPT